MTLKEICEELGIEWNEELPIGFMFVHKEDVFKAVPLFDSNKGK